MALDRRSMLASGVAALLASGPARADGPSAGSAADYVAQECAAAGQDGKRVLLVFFASWCTWCIPMDVMLEDPEAEALLDPHFRIVHLRARERSDEGVAQQLDGADAVFEQIAGLDQGLPFSAVLDADGQTVTTSVSTLNGENFGFPVTDEELDGFEAMLAIAAPSMSAHDRAALREACVRALESLRT